MKILIQNSTLKDFCIINCSTNNCSEHNVICNTNFCGGKCATLTRDCIPGKVGKVAPFNKGKLK
ncbi:MAG: hypothetical protein Q4E02_00025 [Lagierella massiliensis]|nr:hypothetical protein [Lagierella massiliensis]